MHGCIQIILKAVYIGPYTYVMSICVYSYGTPICVYGTTDFAPYMPVFDLNMSFTTLKFKLKPFWKHFLNHFDNNNNCTLHYHCPCLGCRICRPSTVNLTHAPATFVCIIICTYS